MDIDELLNRYFEGETSSEEERELRAFFTSGNVPDRLAVYTPMFTYLEEESRKERQPDEALIPIDEDILFMLDAGKVEEKKTFLYDPCCIWYPVSPPVSCCFWGLTIC